MWLPKLIILTSLFGYIESYARSGDLKDVVYRHIILVHSPEDQDPTTTETPEEEEMVAKTINR